MQHKPAEFQTSDYRQLLKLRGKAARREVAHSGLIFSSYLQNTVGSIAISGYSAFDAGSVEVGMRHKRGSGVFGSTGRIHGLLPCKSVFRL